MPPRAARSHTPATARDAAELRASAASSGALSTPRPPHARHLRLTPERFRSPREHRLTHRGRLASSAWASPRERGQATVELVALLPCLVALLAAVWQAVLVGWAAWGAHAAARAAARAHAIDRDAVGAARRHLPRDLERGLRVTSGERGAVRVVVRIPSPPALPSLGHIGADGRFEPQT
jgi:hypothetical protein